MKSRMVTSEELAPVAGDLWKAIHAEARNKFLQSPQAVVNISP